MNFHIFAVVLAISATFVSANSDTCYSWELPNFCEQDMISCQVICKGAEVSRIPIFKQIKSSLDGKYGNQLCSITKDNDLECNLKDIPDDRRQSL